MVGVANLTITVPDDLLRRARLRAAQEGRSLNSVLRSELAHYVDDDAEIGQAWDAFLEITKGTRGRSSTGRRDWTRDDLQRQAGDSR